MGLLYSPNNMALELNTLVSDAYSVNLSIAAVLGHMMYVKKKKILKDLKEYRLWAVKSKSS